MKRSGPLWAIPKTPLRRICPPEINLSYIQLWNLLHNRKFFRNWVISYKEWEPFPLLKKPMNTNCKIALSAALFIAVGCGPGLKNPSSTVSESGYQYAFGYLQAAGMLTSASQYGFRPGADGSFYTFGRVSKTVDFNPYSEVDLQTAASGSSFLTRFDSTNNYCWTKVFNSTTYITITNVVGDSSGNVFVVGVFSGTADLDPTSSTDSKTATGPRDMFLVKLDSLGGYLWGKHWAGNDYLYPADMVLGDSNSVYFVGSLVGTLDFDPGTAIENHTATLSDSYLIKMSSDGNYLWGFHYNQAGYEVAEDVDYRNGVVYMAGVYSTGDFDPSGATNNLTSLGGYDTYVSRFNSDSSYISTQSFGASGTHDYTRGLAVDADGNCYVATSNSSDELKLWALNSSYEQIWSHTFSGVYPRVGFGYGDVIRDSLAVDGVGRLRFAGNFTGAVDFNPSGGGDTHVADGATADAFVCSFEAKTGEYLSSVVVGGAQGDEVMQVFSLGDSDTWIAGKTFAPVFIDLVGESNQETPSTDGAYFFSRIHYLDSSSSAN